MQEHEMDYSEYSEKISDNSRKKWIGFIHGLTALILAGVFFGGAAALTFYSVQSIFHREVEIYAQEQPIIEAEIVSVSEMKSPGMDPVKMDISDIAEQALPGVVSITNLSIQEYRNFYRQHRPGKQVQETASWGSGVIINNDGNYYYILTNAHVVERAQTLTVGFADGSASNALLCGTDEGIDLAVIKVAAASLSEETKQAICVEAIGDSRKLRVGEQVVAIGNAMGYGQSVTTGIVSALNRYIEDAVAVGSGFIQTDAAINPGNSGGALLNMRGELVGINSAKLSSSGVEGMGYAIPISDILQEIGALMEQSTPITGADTDMGYTVYDPMQGSA